jgi:hypothetical protein
MDCNEFLAHSTRKVVPPSSLTMRLEGDSQPDQHPTASHPLAATTAADGGGKLPFTPLHPSLSHFSIHPSPNLVIFYIKI